MSRVRIVKSWPCPPQRVAGPVMFAIALQLLAYHVAVARGTDVDKPRNLAKV